MNQSKVFEGTVVIELASVLAGPSVGSFLAELGATVIKIENPRTQGDTTRNWKTASENPESSISSYYSAANWNKKVVFLDLNEPDQLRKLHEYLVNATFLLENFKPGDDIKFGLDYKSLKELYPNIIVGHIQGFSDNARPAFDIVVQAEAGYISLNGNGGENFKWPLPIIDILAAHQLKEGLLIGYLERLKNKGGCYVSVSLFDAAIAALYNIAGNVLMGQSDPVSLGRLHPNIAPYGETITSSDGITIVLAVGTDHQFAELAISLGLPPEFQKMFSTNSARLSNRIQLETQLREQAAKLPFVVIEHALVSRNVPFGRINSVKSVLEKLPEHHFLQETIEGINTVRMRTGIFKISY